jgi:predicted ribosome quality control (RQC) complex YloA/Tae2 family protein
VLTDWLLVRRLARELEARLRGSKVVDAGLLPDGRTAIVVRRGSTPRLLAFDTFGSPPAVAVEDGELGILVEPGFVRALAASLRGSVLTAVKARHGDRVLRCTFSSRSRFGVGDEFEVYAELIPRFGNIVLTKGETVVAAAKEFSPAENARRSVQAGLAYELPPLPPNPGSLPRALAAAGVSQTEFDRAAAEPDGGDLYVYRRDGELVQAHVLPLPSLADAQCTREASLLDVLAEWHRERIAGSRRQSESRRRDALIKRLRERAVKLHGELDGLAAKRSQAGERDELRAQGEAIYGTLHDLQPEQREEAKDRAAALFARYKKLGAALPHVERREKTVRIALDAVAALAWEAERAAPEDVADVEAAAAQLDPHVARRTPERAPARKRKRAPLEFRTAGGSRIIVGRSPIENADVTFRIARPHDLWFHARGIPGAHVVLSRDDREEPPEDDVRSAAALAAFYSKAKTGVNVPVDYTQRKHVRKQRDAPPGLVWYTDASTVTVSPADTI